MPSTSQTSESFTNKRRRVDEVFVFNRSFASTDCSPSKGIASSVFVQLPSFSNGKPSAASEMSQPRISSFVSSTDSLAVNDSQSLAISSVSAPLQPRVPITSTSHSLAISSVSDPSQPHINASHRSAISSVPAPSQPHDNLFPDYGIDNATVIMPAHAHSILASRSTSGIAISSFSDKRKRNLSVPHHVVRNRHFKSVLSASPTEKLVSSPVKRMRIDQEYVMARCHATDAPT